MAKRRDAYTAALFLAALAAAVIFLLLGVIPTQSGMTARARRSRSATARSGTKVVAEAPSEPSSDAAARDRSAHKAGRSAPDRRREAPALKNHAVSADLLGQAEQAVERVTTTADKSISALLDQNHAFIELYGGVQRLLGRRLVEDAVPQYTVAQLENGLLTFANPDTQWHDPSERAQEMIEFAQLIWEDREYPLLYVQVPSKLSVSDLPEGMTDYTEAEADLFLALLEESGVDTLDLRPIYAEVAQRDPEEAQGLFFRTDHHWTPAGAFLGYQAICEKLRQDYGFEIDEVFTDPDSFTRYNFEEVFLGSQGRRVGSLYAGKDDLELWSPKFETSLRYVVSNTTVDRKGAFDSSVLFPERLRNTDPYTTNAYTIYSGGDFLLARTYNQLDPEGKRILILRDSFGCTLTPFLSLACGELQSMDPRMFDSNQATMLTYLHWLRPDLVIVLNTTSSLRVDKLYPYLPSARTAVLQARNAGVESGDFET